MLKEHFIVGRAVINKDLLSFDGTRKWLLEHFPIRTASETVFIPERRSRGALRFVAGGVHADLHVLPTTGTMDLVRNLSAGEIIGQVMTARDGLRRMGPRRSVRIALFTNIVMMGMGEPLFNYENVARALTIRPHGRRGDRDFQAQDHAFDLGRGADDERCARSSLAVKLAISLHAVRDDLRDEIVPLNKKYPIAELLKACREYPAANNARRITFEYVMLKGINDSDADARELVRLLSDIHAKVNLIPFNPWPGAPYECSTRSRINAFAAIVNDAGYSSPVRKTRGQDIYAACGQLKSESVRKGKVWLGDKPTAAS